MSKLAILCVDDESTVLNSLKKELEPVVLTKDITLEFAESGEEALEVYEEFQKDNIELAVLISDHIMPGMKGSDLIIKMHIKSPSTSKILLTGQADAEAVGQVSNYNALYRYIGKPWDAKDLQLTVTEALRSYQADVQLQEQRNLIEDLQANVVDNFISSGEITLSNEELYRKVFYQRFLNFLEPEAQKWVTNATIGVICSDQKVSQTELVYINALASVNKSKERVQSIVNMVKAKTKPEVKVLKVDLSLACEILNQLIQIVINDGKVSPNEVEYIVYLGGKLGIVKETTQELINVALQKIKLNKDNANIIKSIKNTGPIYMNYS